jgi:putative endonuclease
MKHGGCVYILTNKRRTVLYTGVTASLSRRVWEHKEKIDPKSFSAKYNCDTLVYYKPFHHIEDAIVEETRIKGLSRSKKDNLINSMNPEWKDLYPDLVE